MRLLFFLLIPFISYSQVGQKLKLRQLEVGPPNAAVLTDSTGAIIFGAAESGGGGPTIYTGSGTVQPSTLVSVPDGDGSEVEFAIGDFPSWPDVNLNGTERGYMDSPNYWELVALINKWSSIQVDNTSVETISKGLSGTTSVIHRVDGLSPSIVNQIFNGTDETGNFEFKIEQTLPVFQLSSNDVTIGSAKIFIGKNDPNGVVLANSGSIFIRTDGGAGTSFYVKETDGVNTGWVGK